MYCASLSWCHLWVTSRFVAIAKLKSSLSFQKYGDCFISLISLDLIVATRLLISTWFLQPSTFNSKCCYRAFKGLDGLALHSTSDLLNTRLGLWSVGTAHFCLFQGPFKMYSFQPKHYLLHITFNLVSERFNVQSLCSWMNHTFWINLLREWFNDSLIKISTRNS